MRSQSTPQRWLLGFQIIIIMTSCTLSRMGIPGDCAPHGCSESSWPSPSPHQGPTRSQVSMHHQALPLSRGADGQQWTLKQLQGQMEPALGWQEPWLTQREGVSAEYREERRRLGRGSQRTQSRVCRPTLVQREEPTAWVPALRSEDGRASLVGGKGIPASG